MQEFFRRKMAFFRQVSAYVVKTVRSIAGVIRVTDAVAGNAHAVVVQGDAWVRNQLVQNGNFADGTTGWTAQNLTASAADNVATLSYNIGSMNRNIRISPSLTGGHVYMLCCQMRDSGVPGQYAFVVAGGPSKIAGTSKSWTFYSAKFEPSASGVFNMFFCVTNGELTEDTTAQLRNVQLVDLTQLCNGDATKIAAITSWSDLVAQYPEYGSYVAYDTGTVVGLQSALSTGVWNQLIDASNAIRSNLSSSQASITNDTANRSATLTAVNANIGNGFVVSATLTAGHKYLVRTLVTEPSVPATFRISYPSVSNTVDVDIVDTTETEVAGIIEMKTSTNYIVLYANVQSPHMPAGESCTIRDTMLIDLTLLFAPGQEPTTVQEVRDYCAAIGHDLDTYQAYDAGTSLGGTASTQTLYAAGTARDLQDVVSGEVARRVWSVDMGTLTWGAYYSADSGHPYGYTIGLCTGKLGGYSNLISANYPYGAFSQDKVLRGYGTPEAAPALAERLYLVDSSLLGKTGAEIATTLSGKTLYYELATPTTSTVTAQPLALQKGSNSIYQTDAGRTADFDLTYQASN